MTTRGEIPALEQTISGLRIGLLLAVAVIFLLLAANFQSARLALTIVLTVPAVLCGVLLCASFGSAQSLSGMWDATVVVPSLHNLPQGCSFAPRCDFATDQCRAASPPLVERRAGHAIACWHADKLLADAA